MKIMKYIIDESGVPTLFETNIIHSDVKTTVVSAGFVIINYDLLKDQFNIKCYGCSDSLKISANKNDDLIIQDYLDKFTSK